MLLTQHAILLLLVFVTSSFTLTLDRRQSSTSDSLISCAPAPIRINQFNSFSGSASQLPHVTFYLTNSNPGAPAKMLCTATMGSGEGSFNGSTFYSCEQPGTGFNYQANGQLKVFQYMVCTTGSVKSISRQVIIAAEGEIATESYPGEYGGEYQESITGSTAIPVTNVQDVRTLNGQQGRVQLAEQNVTCGFVGAENIVYVTGLCQI